MKRQFNLRFFAIFMLVMLVSMGGLVFAYSYQVSRHADVFLKRGQEAEKNEEYAEAINFYSRYLAFRPTDAAARGQFGLLVAKKAVSYKQKESALLTLERALREDPSLSDIRRKAAELAIEIERFSDASVHIEKLLGENTSDAGLYELLGECKEDGGLIPEAIVNYEKALQLSPDRIKSYERLSAIHIRMSRFKESDEVMAQMIKNNPDSIRARLVRSNYFRMRGNIAQAREDLSLAQKALAAADNQVEILLASAELATADNKNEEAREYYRKGMQLPENDLRFVLGLANLELMDGRREEAATILKSSQKAGSKEPGELWSLADLYISADETEEAEKLIASLKGQVLQSVLDYLQARLLIKKGDYSEAITTLDRCRAEFLRFPDLTIKTELLISACYQALGQDDQRIDACRRALQVDRASYQARSELASAYLALNQIDEAIREYQTIRNTNSKEGVSTIIARIRLWQSEKQPTQRSAFLTMAQAEMDSASEREKKTPEYQLTLASLLIAKDQRVNAKKFLTEARDQSPQEVKYWQALVSLALAEGNPTEADAILNQARKQLGNRVELILSRISMMMRQKADIKEFRQLETDCKDLSESDFYLMAMTLSDIYLRLNATADAERILQKAIEKRPNDLKLLYRFLDVRLDQGNIEQIGEVADQLRRTEGEQGVVWRFADAYRNWQIYVKDKSSASLVIAKSRLDEAAKIRPNWYRAPLLEASILQQTGQIESAIEKYKDAIQKGARDPGVVQNLVQLLLSRRRYDEARDQIRQLQNQSIQLTPEINKQAIAIALTDRDTKDAALKSAEKLVSEDTKDYREVLWLGMIYLSNNDKARAEASLQKAIKLAPDQPETRGIWVQFLVQNDRKPEALKEVETIKASFPDKGKNGLLAGCYEALGERAEAEKYYLALEKESPNDVGTLRSLATFYLASGETAKSITYFRRLIDQADTGSELRRIARRSLAIALLSSGNFLQINEALALVEMNLREVPGSAVELRTRAMIQSFRPGGRQQSIKDFEDSFTNYLPSPSEEFVLARLYELEGDWLKAKNRFENLLSKPTGRNPNYFSHYIRALLRRNDLDSAKAWFNRLAASENNSQSPAVIEMKARILAKEGSKSEAGDLLKKFASTKYMENKNPNIWRDVGRLMAELKLSSAAEEMLRQYVKEVEAKSPAAVLILAEFLARDDRVSDAIQLCSQAVNSAGPELAALIAASAVRLGKPRPSDFTAASAVIDAALKQKPKSIDLLISQAELRDAQGRYEDAITAYRAILAVEPSNEIALNNLSWLLAFQPNGAGEALTLIDKAIANAGNQGNFLDTRGVILMNLGRYDEAIKTLGEAVSNARSPESYYHLALAHHKGGQALEAGRSIRQAREDGFTSKYLHPLEIKDYEAFIKVIGEDDAK